jgi:CDP-2,3-bis-(O-geranylgeranyl)-sn-glycerol synthase
MTEQAFHALLFFLPAGVANMTPIIASRLPFLQAWNAPLDFGKTWRGKRIFGANKTWRGLIVGTLAGTVLGVAMFGAAGAPISFAISFGALAGDAIESFFKRQRGINSGVPWFPFDQTDYIIGGLLCTLPFGILPLWTVVWVFVLYFGLHLVSSYLGYLMGFKERPI